MRTERIMTDFYQQHYSTYFERTFAIDPASFLEPLVTHLIPGAKILDVGCGSGRDMLWLKERGFDVTGFERSAGLANLAKKHTVCKVLVGDFETFDFSTLSMDAIVLVGALVHVPHKNLAAIFSHITKCLKQGGGVLLSLKQGEGTDRDQHGRTFYLWQDHELRLILNQLGLHVLNHKVQASKINPEDTWIGYVLEKVI